MSPYRERAIDIYERRLRGQHWTEIAAAFGVTRERAQQIVWEHEEWLAGHIRATDGAEPGGAIADTDALDMPPTRALYRASGGKRRRMQRWWLEESGLSSDELLEISQMIGWTD
jgi:hypothetical protein